MAGGGGGKTLEQTPTWAVAVVCFVLVAISIVIEYIIHLIGKWLKSKHKRALYEALEKIKSELMLLGFISLLLTVLQGPISNICIPASVGATWHPCSKKDEEEKYKTSSSEQHWELSSEENSRRRLLAAGGEVRRVLAAAADPERFRFARETSFGRRHLSFWTKTPILLWIVCFFRQFIRSVPKVDYLTLRHGFIMAHLAPQSQTKFDFQKYIKRSLEEDFKVVVGISPIIWLFAVLFLLFNTHGWYSYLWLPFIPLIIILLVGTKLQVIITKMGLRIQERGEVVKGVPVVEPGDDLFWFNCPRLILFLINFVLFQNAFQLAFFAWAWILCSYVTLPLYALVTQMGSNMKPTIFNERVATALKKWHHTAKKNVKESRHNSAAVTPVSSRPGTPSHGMSPVHLLRGYYRSDQADSAQSTPRRSNYEFEHWDADDHDSPSHTRFHNHGGGDGSSSSSYMNQIQLGHIRHDVQPVHDPRSLQMVPVPPQHEIHIEHSDFSFDRMKGERIMESFEGMLTKLGRQFYAVVWLGAVLLSAAVVHYVCADESDSDERRRRERTMKRFRAFHGPPLRSTYR
nr:MLO-like protein 6 [Ipomoea batatas]